MKTYNVDDPVEGESAAEDLLSSAQPLDNNSLTREKFLYRVLLVGHTGTGKSTVATTLKGKKLILDLDGRKESIEGLPTITPEDRVIQILEPDPKSPSAWSRLDKLGKYLWYQVRSGTFDWKILNIQGLTAINRYCMNWCLLLDPKRGLGGSAAKQHYGPHIKNLSDFFLSILSLPCHVIVESHFNIIDDEESGGSILLPKVYGQQQRTELPGWFNEVWLTEKSFDDKKGRNKYFIHTSGHDRYDFFKSALNQLGRFWKDPVEIDLNQDPCGMELMLDYRFGKEKK